MKKIILMTLLALVSALTIVSCTEDETIRPTNFNNTLPKGGGAGTVDLK